MKFGKSFEKVKLRDYAKLTAEIGKDSLDLAVKKLSNIKSLEIEYFTQTGKNGAAVALFELLLDQPDSKAWETLADQLVTVLRFWIDAVRKKVSHKLDHWWEFLKRILKFVQVINYKEDSVPDKLLQLSPSLLDLSCEDILSPQQCIHVLHSLNMFSALSSRGARLDNKPRIADYFPKLGRQITTSGHYPYQFKALECIVRWIVPRDTATLRAAAAACFPRLSEPQRDAFVLAKWGIFVQNARDFLNAINAESGLVKSVMYKKITVGDMDIFTSSEHLISWLDINSSDGSVSVVLEPRALQRLVGLETSSCEALVFAPTAVTVRSGSQEVVISLKTAQPPQVLPSSILVGTGCDVTALVSSRENVQALHDAMRNIFGDKYQRLFSNDANMLPIYSPVPSPYESSKSSGEFSSAPANKSSIRPFIRTHCGDSQVSAAQSRQSSVSSASLAQLRVKLTALPKTVYEKEFRRLKERLDSPLSHISEETSHARQHFGECIVRKAFSDIEGKTRSNHNLKGVRTAPSPLQKATISTDNIVDLLIKEVESNRKPFIEKPKKGIAVVSKTTTEDEEYNTDVISDSQRNVTLRISKKSSQAKTKDRKHIEDQQISNKAMEDEGSVFYEDVDMSKELQEVENLTNKIAKQTFKEKNSANTTSNRQAKSETVSQTRPRRTKKLSYKACEALNDKCASDETPVVEAKRKRKLYSPKDDDNAFSVSSKTNKPNTLQRSTPYKKIVAQRQKFHHPLEKKAPENVSLNEELLTPKTIQKKPVFDKVVANENNATGVVEDKQSKKDVYIYTSEETDTSEDFNERRMNMARRNSVLETKKTKIQKGVKKPAANRRTKTTVKTTKKKNPRRNSQATKIIEPPLEDLEDERMRTTNNDNALDSSFVQMKRNKEQAPLSFSSQLQSEMIGDKNAKKINQRTISVEQQDKLSFITARRCTRAMSAKLSSPIPSEDSDPFLPPLQVENTTSKRNDDSLEELCNMSEETVNLCITDFNYQPIQEQTEKPLRDKPKPESNTNRKQTVNLCITDFNYQHIQQQTEKPLRNKPKPESNTNRKQAQKISTSECKSIPGTKSALSKGNNRRVEDESEPEDESNGLDMAMENGDNSVSGNITAPKAVTKPEITNELRKRCDSENVSDTTEKNPGSDTDSEKHPNEDFDAEMSPNREMIIQGNRGSNSAVEALQKGSRRDSATHTSPSKSNGQSTVENAVDKTLNRTLRKTLPKYKSTEPRPSPSQQTETTFDEQIGVSTTLKRKASPERLQSAKAPRIHEEPPTHEDEVSYRQKKQAVSVRFNRKPNQQRVNWKTTDDASHILKQLPLEYTEDFPKMLDFIRKLTVDSETPEENTGVEDNNPRQSLQKKDKFINNLQRANEKLNKRFKWNMSDILEYIKLLQSETREDHDLVEDQQSCIHEKNIPGVAEQNDNPQHTDDSRHGTNQRVNWLVSKIVQSFKQLELNMSEDLGSINKLVKTLEG